MEASRNRPIFWGRASIPRCTGRKELTPQQGARAAVKPAIGLAGAGLDPDSAEAAFSRLSPEERSRTILSIILKELDDDKAENVVTIDLAGKSDIADAMVVASGRSQRHVGAMADKVMRRLKEAGFGRARVEGKTACDWVLIDAEDVIVHLFRPEVRDFYNLERVWSEAAHAPAAPKR
ncbi:MAG: ribosome silencing factor [Parvularculaceae bacterium]